MRIIPFVYRFSCFWDRCRYLCHKDMKSEPQEHRLAFLYWEICGDDVDTAAPPPLLFLYKHICVWLFHVDV